MQLALETFKFIFCSLLNDNCKIGFWISFLSHLSILETLLCCLELPLHGMLFKVEVTGGFDFKVRSFLRSQELVSLVLTGVAFSAKLVTWCSWLKIRTLMFPSEEAALSSGINSFWALLWSEIWKN